MLVEIRIVGELVQIELIPHRINSEILSYLKDNYLGMSFLQFSTTKKILFINLFRASHGYGFKININSNIYDYLFIFVTNCHFHPVHRTGDSSSL